MANLRHINLYYKLVSNCIPCCTKSKVQGWTSFQKYGIWYADSDFTIELLGEECLGSALKIEGKESWPLFEDTSIHDLRVYKTSSKDDK